MAIQNFHGDGIALSGTSGNLIAGNYLGTNQTGTTKLSNGVGLEIEGGATANTIGGTVANLISGNSTAGVLITGSGSSGNVVLGNLIGTQKNGTTKLGNGVGVEVEGGATGNTIGGTVSGNGNIIAFNADGVSVSGSTTVGDSILGNSIFQNTGAGIDLGNPPGNDGQAAPVLKSADTQSISGTLNSAAGSYRVEVFAYPTTDTVIEGKVYLGFTTVTLAVSGDTQAFTLSGLKIPAAMLLSATATNTATGDTSAFASFTSAYTVTTVKDVRGDTKHLANGTPEVTLRDVLTAISTGTASGNAQAPGSSSAIILFAIGTSGSVQAINLNSPLPTLTVPTIIDGLTQGGSGYSGVPLIVLNGARAGANANGLTLVKGSDGSTVEGLVLQRFGGNAIVLNGTNGDLLKGNYLGTNAAGTGKLGNGVGVLMEGGATANTVGGKTANLISGNTTAGVVIRDGGTSGNVVLGNFIGTQKSGTVKLGNADGVDIGGGATANTVGGTTAAAGNVLSGNTGNGVLISDAGTSGNVVLGNFVGTDSKGSINLGNTVDGVQIAKGASANTIGGTVTGSGNAIAFNAKGVVVTGQFHAWRLHTWQQHLPEHRCRHRSGQSIWERWPGQSGADKCRRSKRHRHTDRRGWELPGRGLRLPRFRPPPRGQGLPWFRHRHHRRLGNRAAIHGSETNGPRRYARLRDLDQLGHRRHLRVRPAQCPLHREHRLGRAGRHEEAVQWHAGVDVARRADGDQHGSCFGQRAAAAKRYDRRHHSLRHRRQRIGADDQPDQALAHHLVADHHRCPHARRQRLQRRSLDRPQRRENRRDAPTA